MINMVDFEVYLQGGSPWGFRLQGGREFRMPIRIAKVEPGGKAHNGGVQVGDHVTEIDGINTENMYHTEALTAVKRAQYSLSLLLTRPDSNGEPGNAIQSVGLTPEATNTKVSLVIGPKRSVSSDRINKSTEDIPNEDLDIPQGQTYMKKLIRNKNLDEEPVIERPVSASLPRNLRRHEDNNNTHPDYSSKSLPRKKENGYTHPEYSSKSLPRNRTKSTSDAPSKAPSWYKNMYKEMHTSMEKESHLSKLLASDAKRGAFRKYDGITSPLTQRSNDCYNIHSTYEDAPRRLQGGGRSIANHPNRKSLPNIHAASFNFMTDHSNTKPDTCNKPDSGNKAPHSSVNSDWYRHIQKGGNIPETGLAVKTTDSSNILEKNKPRGPHSPKWETLIPAPDDPPDILPNKIDVPKPINISVEYNNPPDFLELRKQEIKNREIEKERETIRQQREKERLAEEERLLEQKTRDFLRIEEEKRRLKLKEEELKLKEELLLQQEEEREEKRLHKLQEMNLKRLVQEEKQLKLKEEEIKRREEEEKRLLKLKEEELQRKEELLLKQEQELEERRHNKLKEEERIERELDERRQMKLIEEERLQRELEEKRLLILKEEEERKQRELEEERLRKLKEEEERKLRELEEERLKLLIEEERKQRELEEERLRILKEEEERKLRELEEERLRILKEEEERKLRELEEERLRKEEEECKLRELEKERLLKLKEEEERRQRELEEQRIQMIKEEEERQRLELQRKAEELDRKEKEEERLLKLKEEELNRKEELLLKMEAEQMEKQRLLEESLKPQLPPYGKAKYSFHPQGPGELEFKKGEIITIIGAVDENWIEGEHKGNIGIFPVSYVELLDSLPGEIIPENIAKPVIDIQPEITKVSEDEGKQEEELDSKYLEPTEELVADTPQEEPEVFALVNGTAEDDIPVVSEENIIVEKELNVQATPEEVISNADADDIPDSSLPHIEEGVATARYTFKAETDSELSFKKGDEIILLKRVDDNWYEGELNGQIGILPVNYVKVSKEPVVIEPVIVPEPEPEPEPLPLAKIIDEPMPANILKSRKVEDRKPSAEMIIDDVLNAHAVDKRAKEDPTMTNGYDHANGPGKTFIDDLIGQGDPYKAVYKYAATNEDEIELLVGDVVHVLEKCDDNWYIGTSERTGAFGTFPGNYVTPL